MKMDHFGRREVSEKKETKLRLKDKLSQDYTLIYKSTLDNYVFFCYHASYIIVIGALIGIYYVIVNSPELEYLKPDTERELTKPNLTLYDQKEIILGNIGLVFMNALLFFLCRRHVLRIWHHAKDNEFVIILPTLLPNSSRNLVFKAGDVVQKYPRARNDITRAPHVINGKVYHLNDYNFRTPADYNRVLDL